MNHNRLLVKLLFLVGIVGRLCQTVDADTFVYTGGPYCNAYGQSGGHNFCFNGMTPGYPLSIPTGGGTVLTISGGIATGTGSFTAQTLSSTGVLSNCVTNYHDSWQLICTVQAGALGSANIIFTDGYLVTLTLTGAFTYVSPTKTSQTSTIFDLPGGTLTLTGTYWGTLTGSYSIMLNGPTSVPCTVTAVSPTSISFTVPSLSSSGGSVDTSYNVVISVLSNTLFTIPVIYYTMPTAVSFGSALSVSIGGGDQRLIIGHYFGTHLSSITLSVIDASGINTPCSCVLSNAYYDLLTCSMPSVTAATSALALNLTVRNWVFISSPLVTYVTPLITSVSPSAISIAGGVVTVTGTGFGYNKNYWTYLSVLAGVPVTPSTCSGTQMVATFPAGTGSGLTLALAWGSGPYTTLTNALSYVAPTITGVSPSTISSASGGTVTVTGINFGSNVGFYSYLSIVGGVGRSPSSVTNTQIIVVFPGGTGSSLTLYLAWGSGPYTSYPNAVSYV
jgi:hypothetical protein